MDLQLYQLMNQNHGRSTSDTVRFRDASNVANLPAATINASGGYTITKVNDNNYTFSSGVTASVTLKGGGDIASAGPVTVKHDKYLWNWIKNIFKPSKQDPHLTLYDNKKCKNKKNRNITVWNT